MSLDNKASTTPVNPVDEKIKPTPAIAQPAPQPNKVGPAVTPPAKPQS